MKMKINELMEAVHCSKWPERWNDIYDSVMADFEKNGCELTDPDYYDRLGEKYSVLVKHRELYKQAAVEVGKSYELSAFLALLVASLLDRENSPADLKEFSQPKLPDGKHDLAIDMLTGLAICALVPYCYNKLKARNLPEDIIIGALRLPENGIGEYEKRYGVPGFNYLGWFMLAIEGRLFRIDRLEMEIGAKFGGRACVFMNDKGEHIPLAHDRTVHRDGFALGAHNFEDEEGSWTANVEETEDAYIGYPYDEKGYVKKKKITLKKSEWRKVIEKGDPMVGVHIPGDGRLDDAYVEETIAHTKEFLAKYFPDYKYKAFGCGSWLMDPQLIDLLGAESNIGKFCKRYTPMSSSSDGNAVFHFVFLKPGKPGIDFKLEDLPENTSLERKLKKLYLEGNCIYEMYGYFF